MLAILNDIHDDIIQKHKWIVRDHIINFHFESAIQYDNNAAETATYLSSKPKVKMKTEGSSYTSLYIYETIWNHNPEDTIFSNICFQAQEVKAVTG